MTRAEMLDRMSSRELTDWMIYDRVEPIGVERLEIAIAQLTTLVANTLRDAKKQRKAWSIYDFLHFVDQPEPEEKEPKTQEEIVAAIFEIFGAPPDGNTSETPSGVEPR